MKATQSSLYRELENLMLWFIPVGNNIPKDFALRKLGERFVDDIPVVLPRKSDVLLFHREAKRFLEDRIHLSLHPDKIYIQHVSKGVKFVGSVIKPGRMYLNNRTVGKMHEMLSDMERCCKRVARKKRPSLQDAEELEHWVCSCNSYMGFLVHHASYGLRRRMFGRMKWFWKCTYLSDGFKRVKLRNRYRLATVLAKRNTNHF